MKLLFLLAIVPVMVLCQDIAIDPIIISKPYPSPISTTEPRIIPKTQFVVLAPYLIRPGKPFNVAIRRWGAAKSLTFTLTISGTRQDGSVITPIVTKAYISSLSTGTFVSLNCGTLPKGTYFLTVQGDGYTDKRALTYATKTSSIVLQLNKSIFSPGQTVQFRIFSFNSETNAVTPSDKCIVTINDADGNKIETFEGFDFTKGKVEREFKLASRPPLGLWSMVAQCGSEYAFENFEVDEYKLPAYEAIVSIPTFTPYADGKVPVQITATYSFGDPVTGSGTFTVTFNGNNIITRQVQIVNGICSFDLSVTDLQAQPGSYQYYQYTFTMTDSTINSPAGTEGYFEVRPFSYYIEFSGEQFFTAGSTYAYSILVKKLDGTPAPIGTNVVVKIFPQNINQSLTLDSNGRASSTVATPTDGSSYMSFEANSNNAQAGYWYAYIPWTGQGTFLSLAVTTKEPRINNYVTITATVGEDISSFVYAITAKGVFLKSDRIYFASGKRTATFSFKPDFTFAPLTKIVAYYINKKGDFVVGSTNVFLTSDLPNYVKLGFSNVEVKPGANYTFSVQSKCGSTVSINAIDTRVLQLRSGNNLIRDDIINPLFEHQYRDWFIWEDRYYPDYEWQFRDCILYPITNIPPPPRPEYDFSFAPPQADAQESQKSRGQGGDVKVRKDFSETFCWTDLEVNTPFSKFQPTDCRCNLKCQVPESLTKYLVYGVSMNTKYGMGVTDPYPSNITTSLPFFIVMETPYEVQRNELLVLDIVHFYKINKNQTVTISIPKSKYYTAVDLANYGWSTTTTSYVKTYNAIANTNFKVQFALKFNSIGNYPVTVTSKSSLAGDGIEKTIRVIPEGIERTITASNLFVVQDPSQVINTDLVCNYPPGTYEDTKSVTATVIGDLLGTALENLENLIQMPGGCGEQTLLSLVPDLAIYKYLQATGKLTPAIEAKLIEYIKFGIQNQLAYKRSDGGFSAFGDQDPASSTWLTAYTLKAFILAAGIALADTNVILGAVNFIISQQNADGSFNEPGRVIHVDMQGGTAQGIAMIAYVADVLNDARDDHDFPYIGEAYQKAITFLVGKVSEVTDVYELGILAYALKRAGQEDAAQIAFDKFYALRIETPTTLNWQKTSNPPPYSYTAPSLDIEISSYGLKLMILYSRTSDAIKIVKYLISQSNQFGGYGSSQDTVMGLLALSDFAGAFSSSSIVDLNLTPNVGSPFTANIDPSNALTLQQFELDSATTELNVQASTPSSGLAIVSLICHFYQDPAQVVPYFTITSEFYRQCQYSIGFSACASYIPEGNSGMAIMRVKMPSGFRYEQWWGDSGNPEVSKTEVSNGGSLVTFYFNTIGNKPSCVNVNGYRYTFVSELKGGTIIVNDYYDTSKEGTAKYSVPALTGPCWFGRPEPLIRVAVEA